MKSQRELTRIVVDLLTAEISGKQARPIRYQIAITKLPLAKDVENFAFDGTLTDETLVHDRARGNVVADQRNVVLVGDTSTGRTHLAIAFTRFFIRRGCAGAI